MQGGGLHVSLLYTHIPFMVNCTFNATLTERLQHYTMFVTLTQKILWKATLQLLCKAAVTFEGNIFVYRTNLSHKKKVQETSTHVPSCQCCKGSY